VPEPLLALRTGERELAVAVDAVELSLWSAVVG